jgi:hypothetical protein
MRYPMRAIGCIIFRVTQDKLERQNKIQFSFFEVLLGD